jgi:sugar (pentulose or hexulose) kinase
MDLILGIDQSTSGTKALLFTVEWRTDGRNQYSTPADLSRTRLGRA